MLKAANQTKWATTATLAAMLLFQAAANAFADTNTSAIISVNFTGTSANNGTPSPMATNEIAGVLPAANWNNTTNQSSGTLNNLVDGGGNATTASLTWNGTGTGTTAVQDSAGDDRMMKGYVDVTNGSVGTITITNIPDSISSNSYDVIVYFDGANGSANRNAIFTIGNVTYIGKDYTFFAGTYIQTTDTSDNTISATAANFVLFTNVTGNSFTVTATPGYASDNTPHAEFNGIQVIADSTARPFVTTNPVSQTVCAGTSVSFTAAAQSSFSVQWQVKTNGGSSFVNISGATNTTLTVSAVVTNSGNQYQAVFSSVAGSTSTSAATLTVNAVPVATITTNSIGVLAYSSGDTATGPAGASTYAWTIDNGAITGGANSQTVTYSAGPSGSVTLGLTVANQSGCTDSKSIEIPIGLRSVTKSDSIISLATNVTKNYTFTDASTGQSITVAVTMTPYSASNASPVFTLLDNSGGSPTHLGINSGLNSGDGNWVDYYEGVDFSATLVSATSAVDTNSIQFGITAAGFRNNGTFGLIDWSSSATAASTFNLTNAGLWTLDTGVASLAGTNYSGHLRTKNTENYQLNNASPITGQSIAMEITFSQTIGAATVGTASVTNNQFQFIVTGTTGENYIVQATTNLVSADWVSISTNTVPFTFTESDLDSYSQRFYRVVAP